MMSAPEPRSGDPAEGQPAPSATDRPIPTTDLRTRLRSIAVRLAALLLLLGATAPFIDYPGLLQEASRDLEPIDPAAVTIIDAPIAHRYAVLGHSLLRRDEHHWIVIRLRPRAAVWTPSAREQIAPERIRAVLLDEAGREFGWQSTEVDFHPDGSVATTRVRVDRRAMPATVRLEPPR